MGAILGVLLVVVGLDIIFLFVDEVRRHLENAYQVKEAAMYCLLLVPKRIHDLLPLVALIGCLAGMGVLANNSELTIMRASGVSLGRIVISVMRPTFLLMVISFVLGEFVGPVTEEYAESKRAMEIGGKEINFKKGEWHREGNTYMYFSVVESSGVITGLTAFDYNDERELVSSSYAQKAIYQGSYWVMQNVTTTHYRDSGNFITEAITKDWQTDLTPDLLSLVVLEPSSLPIYSLVKYTYYLKDQGLDSKLFELAMWRKMFQPLSTAALVLVGLSFIFGPLRSVTMGLRIFSGVITGLIFQLAQDMLGPASLVYGFKPIWASLIPLLTCFGIGAILLWRAG